MALSCPQCGAAVAPGMRACQFCGTRVESPEPAPAETVAAQTPFEEPASAPPVHEVVPAAVTPASLAEVALPSAIDTQDLKPATAAKKAKPAPQKSRAMSCVVTAFIGVIAVWLLIFVGYRVFGVFTGSGPSPLGSPAQSSGESSASDSSSKAASASDLGVDLYPGAQPTSDIDRRDSSDSTVISQSFLSSDKMDYVINFYKARMVGQTSIYFSGSGVMVSISPNPQDTVQVGISPSGTAGGTRIAITHTKTKN